MKTLFIVNDPPYGTERCYNALRLALALAKADADAEIVVFLMADAVAAARKGQNTPGSYYNLERMLKRIAAGNGRALLNGTCMDAREIDDDALIRLPKLIAQPT